MTVNFHCGVCESLFTKFIVSLFPSNDQTTDNEPNRNTIWPDGKRSNQSVSRDDNTKLRTRMAAKVALFTLLAGNDNNQISTDRTSQFSPISMLFFFRVHFITAHSDDNQTKPTTTKTP